MSSHSFTSEGIRKSNYYSFRLHQEVLSRLLNPFLLVPFSLLYMKVPSYESLYLFNNNNNNKISTEGILLRTSDPSLSLLSLGSLAYEKPHEDKSSKPSLSRIRSKLLVYRVDPLVKDVEGRLRQKDLTNTSSRSFIILTSLLDHRSRHRELKKDLTF